MLCKFLLGGTCADKRERLCLTASRFLETKYRCDNKSYNGTAKQLQPERNPLLTGSIGFRFESESGCGMCIFDEMDD